MALMKSSESWAMTAEESVQPRRFGRAARGELELRNAMESILRDRYPGARVCHEMVMGAREVRADIVAVTEDNIAAVEVKGPYDDTTRLLHQVGMFKLCVPEVWMIVSGDKKEDGDLIRYLMPCVGLIAARYNRGPGEWTSDAEIVAPATRVDPHPRMALEMLWADELGAVVKRRNLMTFGSRLPRRSAMIGAALEGLAITDIVFECCKELRARRALWRADDPID